MSEVDKINERKKTLSDFIGILKDSPNFNGDPVEIQRALREEWEMNKEQLNFRHSDKGRLS
jgi:hypothetical protein